ncbi:hypothetical protein BJX66DRAFT_320115 [Aspergillus keveii]|uniref:Uncharacterized protein n=1 Tax=Aspergillus keveii TaxID=714993 RepID=A0ABR4FHG4_9EURO
MAMTSAALDTESTAEQRLQSLVQQRLQRRGLPCGLSFGNKRVIFRELVDKIIHAIASI